jgi:hypothetical protein
MFVGYLLLFFGHSCMQGTVRRVLSGQAGAWIYRLSFLIQRSRWVGLLAHPLPLAFRFTLPNLADRPAIHGTRAARNNRGSNRPQPAFARRAGLSREPFFHVHV